MSEGSLWIDQSILRSGAPAFTDLGNRLGQVFAQLHSALAAEELRWGVDSYGKSFEQRYLPGRDSVMDLFPQAAQALRDIGSGLVESADTADRGETATHSKFTA